MNLETLEWDAELLAIFGIPREVLAEIKPTSHIFAHTPDGVPIAALVAGIAGALLGAPTLKLRGDYLAIVTLGFGEIIRIFMNNLNGPINITNGPQGINLIDPIRIGSISLAGEAGVVRLGSLVMPSVNAYYYLFLLLCIDRHVSLN
jgi:ABC-type branched-subunit amino acid transport system permease subunit